MNVRTTALLAVFAFASVAHARSIGGCPAPNAADPDLVGTIVRTSVPPLTCATLRAKLTPSGDSGPSADFQFFRTVVPWYWDFLRRDAACSANKNQGVLRTELHALAKDFPGLCAGDPHPENFALQFNPPAAPVFGVNDPDDAGENCPVVVDLLRFLVGTKLARADGDAKAMIDRYAAAVVSPTAGAPRSAAIAALVAAGPKPEETALPSSGGPCPKGIREGLTKAYRETLSGGVTIDVDPTDADCVDESAKKESGGSAGLPRYSIRFGLKSGAGPVAPKIVQFKGTQANATAFFSDPPAVWDAKARYAAACVAERGKDSVPCPVVTPVPGGPGFFARTKNERAVKFGKLTKEGAEAVYEDEAGALGALHGGSLGPAKAAEYAKRLLALKDALDVDANALAETVKKSSAALKAVLSTPDAFEMACEPAKKSPPRPASRPASPPPPPAKTRSQSRSAN